MKLLVNYRLKLSVNLWRHLSREEVKADTKFVLTLPIIVYKEILGYNACSEGDICEYNKCIDWFFEAAPQSDYILQKEANRQFFDC